MFKAVYDQHPKLSPAQKLYHLRNKTRGQAGEIVKRFQLCNENYTLAWEALKARYENPRILIDKQLRKLFEIASIFIEDSTSIQKIQSDISNCFSTLMSLDVKIDNWDPILVFLCTSKLPPQTLAYWEQSLKSTKVFPFF